MDQKALVVKSKNKFLKLLPKAASVVNFQNSLNSPKKDKRCENNVTRFKSNLGKGYSSGPLYSMIPPEARRNSKNSNSGAPEPTSPKISCMGTIKHNRKLVTKNSVISFPPESNGSKTGAKQEKKTRPPPIQKAMSFSEGKVKKQSAFRSIFGGGKQTGRNSDASADDSKPPLPDRAPTLTQMRMFASGRDTFVNFDWTAQIALVDSEKSKYFSDDDRGDSEEEEEDEVFSGCRRSKMEPKKEINLWKRRSMAQPKPLQLL